MAYWREKNIKKHYEKRKSKDRECKIVYPEDKRSSGISIEEYRKLSKEAVESAWAKAEFYHEKSGYFRKIFADEDVLLSITESNGNRLETCFHLHYEVEKCKNMMERAVGDRKNAFLRWVEMKKDIGDMDKIKWTKKDI